MGRAQGHGAASNNMGMAYENGSGVPQDAVGAAEWYRRGAQRSFPPAQTNLGRCYRTGVGVPVDLEEALHWFDQGAQQGDAAAQHQLALCHLNGWGSPRDARKAVQVYISLESPGNLVNLLVGEAGAASWQLMVSSQSTDTPHCDIPRDVCEGE